MADLPALDASIALMKASQQQLREQLGAVPAEERILVQQQLLAAQQELVQIQQQKTALLQQQAVPLHVATNIITGTLDVAAGPSSTAVPQIHITLDRAMLAAAMGISEPQEDAVSNKSYLFSDTNWDQAVEAAERLGWSLEPSSDAQVDSARPVEEYGWPAGECEEDQSNRERVAKELKEQLQLPDYVEILPIERKLLLVYEAVHARKRTRLSGKTEFVTVLAAESEHLKMCGAGAGLEWVVNFFETTTALALSNHANQSRGAAAAQCLAANLKLQKAQVKLLPEGFPVVMTDMNRFFLYRQKSDEQVILEITYPNKAVAYDKLSALLRRHSEHVHTRWNNLYQAAELLPAATTADAADAKRASADAGTAAATIAELQAAEVADGARTMAGQLQLQPTGTPGVKVYIEELGAAVARALEQRTAASSGGAGQCPSSSSHTSYVQVPEPFAQIYM